MGKGLLAVSSGLGSKEQLRTELRAQGAPVHTAAPLTSCRSMAFPRRRQMSNIFSELGVGSFLTLLESGTSPTLLPW